MAKKTNAQAQAVENAQAQVVEQAVERRKLDKCYSGQKAMLAAGWTQAEIDALIDAPRSTPDTDNPDEWLPLNDGTDNVSMPDGAKWSFPKVDGFALCGTSLLTKAEKARYRAYVKARESGQVKSTSRTSKATVDMTKWNALLAKLVEIGDEDAIRMFKELMPTAKLPACYKKLTGMDTLNESIKWTFYGMMYRGPNGEVEPTLTAKDIPAKLEAGWEPVILQKQVNTLIDECREHGMIVEVNASGTIFKLGAKATEAPAEAPAQN